MMVTTDEIQQLVKDGRDLAIDLWAMQERAERAERERDEARALLQEARKELEAPSTPYSRRIVIARIDAFLKEKR